MFRYPYDGFQFPINNDQDYLYALQQRSVQNIMQTIRTDHNNLYLELEQEGLNRDIIDALFYLAVNYAVSQSNTNQSPNQMYNRFQNQIPWFGLLSRQFNLPKNRIDRTLERIIEIVLKIIRGEDGRPGPGPSPGQGWSAWEDLGGVLSTSPSAASWQPNRLDVFVGGSDNSMYHIWWDGNRWSNWENLGGILT